MPRGASPKREREYEKLKTEFIKEHRYPGREEEVAARIVNKQRSEQGETKEERAKDRAGRSPDRGLPIPEYQQLTVAQVLKKVENLKPGQLLTIRDYEQEHRARKTLLARLNRLLDSE